MPQPLFHPAEILLPGQAMLDRWAVLACDQFTSQPEYWQETEQIVGDAPSALRVTLPEVYLEQPGVERRIEGIHQVMEQYLADGTLQPQVSGFVYLERTLQNGSIRQGLVGCVDLEEYSYQPGAACRIKPTEGTVVERIPPRLAVRRGAALESPHILMLVDDEKNSVIEPFAAQKGQLAPLYDLELMQGGGRLRGWAVTRAEHIARVQAAIAALEEGERFAARYRTSNPPFVFAVGDGNHSLATAKAYWEELKPAIPAEAQKTHPARYCLVELGNLQAEANEVEPIHRVLFGVDPAQLAQKAGQYAARQGLSLVAGEAEGHRFTLVTKGGEEAYTLKNPQKPLAVGSLEDFLAWYAEEVPALRVDYVHGEAAVRELAAQGAVGIILPPLEKSDLFLGVAQGGVLPRKTFSMGHAEEKRYYMECRKIVE